MEHAIELYRCGLLGGRYDPRTGDRPLRDQAIYRIDTIVEQLRPLYTFSDEESWERQTNVEYQQDGETRYVPVSYRLRTPEAEATMTLGVTTLTGDHDTTDGLTAIGESMMDRERLLGDHDRAALVLLTDSPEYDDGEDYAWEDAGEYRIAAVL